MKVLQLGVENFKRLVAVEINPDGDTVVLTGKNGAGKSSVLEAMFWAIAGAEGAKQMPNPIRNGAEKTTVRVVFDDGLTVEKTTTNNGAPRLKVSDPEGKTYASPQGVLDALRGRLSFDPLAFTRASAKDQVEQLLEATGQKDLLDELETERKEAYEERTVVNREAKRLQSLVDSHGDVDKDLQVKDAQDLLGRLQAAQEVSAKRTRLLEQEERENAHAAKALQEAEDLEARAKKLREEADRCKEAATSARHEAEQIDLPDVDLLKAELADVEEHNAQARKAEQAREDQAKLAEARSQSASLTEGIEKNQEIMAGIIGDASLPVDGLAFNSDGVTYKGVPLKQASQAEQIRVSVGIAMSLNPKLRVLHVKDGSLLDEESMAAIRELAKDRDYQVWIERVGSEGETGILIEDGQVVPAAATQVN